MRELALRGSSDTIGEQERDIIFTEFNQLLEEYVGQLEQRSGMTISSLQFEDGSSTLLFQKGERVFHEGAWISADELLEQTGIQIEAETPGDGRAKASSLVGLVDAWLASAGGMRAGLSAAASRLVSQIERLEQTELDAMQALSRIEDVDFAEEMVTLAKETILAQANLAVIAQANALPERVLTLLDV